MTRPVDAWRPQFHTSSPAPVAPSVPDDSATSTLLRARGVITAALVLSLLGMLALFITPAASFAAPEVSRPPVHVVHDNGTINPATGVTPCTFVSPDYHCHGAEYGNNHSHGNSYVTAQVQNDNLSCLFIPGHPRVSPNAVDAAASYPPQAPCNGARVPFNGYRIFEWDTSDSRTFSNGTAQKPRYTTNFGAWDNSKLDLRWYVNCIPFNDDPKYANITAFLIVGGTNSKFGLHKVGIRLLCDGYDQEIDEDDIDQLIPAKYRNSNLHAHIEFMWNPNHFPGFAGDKENVRVSVFAEHMFNPDPVQVPGVAKNRGNR